MKTSFLVILLISWLTLLPTTQAAQALPAVDENNAIYEVAVEPGVSYDDVVTSLKVISEGLNFVNPANFPIGEHMLQRGMTPQGVLETRSFWGWAQKYSWIILNLSFLHLVELVFTLEMVSYI
jgi:hypothetical protein